jgi:hypothetical protein
VDPATEALFQELADEWKRDTRYESSTTKLVTHRAYQRIIGMGPSAIPLILADLRDRPRQWFWALSAITGEDPAEAEESSSAAAEKWLAWGHARNYLA